MPIQPSVTSALSLIENDKSKQLSLSLDGKAIGLDQYVSRAESQNPPTLTLSTATADKTYIAIALDLSGPYPSQPILSPILHWIQPDLKLITSSTSKTLEATGKPLVDFVAPAPPPFSAPHRYVVLLFEQPAGLKIEKSEDRKGVGMWARARWNFDEWAGVVGLDNGKVVAGGAWMSN